MACPHRETEDIVNDATTAAVVIDGVSKTYKKPRPLLHWLGKKKEQEEACVLNNVSLTIKRREIMGILGANGSGKSTLIRILSTLLTPDAGHVSIFGYDIKKDEQIVQRLIHRVSADASFIKALSPMEHLLFTARLYNLSAAEVRPKAREILAHLGIAQERIGTPLQYMSRGMQQKVAIARVLLTEPMVLLLDEPTTGLDPRSKLEVHNFIRELREAHDTTILITSHDMNEVEALCDSLAILDQGRIVVTENMGELKRIVAQSTGSTTPVSISEVFMHYTNTYLITESDIQNYESWQKTVEVYEPQEK